MSVGAWVTLWVVLIIAAVVFYVLIAVHLYKKVRASLAQAELSVELLAEFTEALDAVEQEPYRGGRAIGAGNEEKAEWVRRRRLNLIRRAKRKQRRRANTYQRWREVSLVDDSSVD